MDYDVIIIGGGPAGYKASILARKHRLNTLLITNRKVGGTCLYEGCIPTKVLLNSGKIYDFMKKSSSYGIQIDNYVYDYQTVIKRKDSIIKKIARSLNMQIKSSGVNFVNGIGTIKGKKNNRFVVTVDSTEYTGKNLIIATGAELSIPQIKGLTFDNSNILTTTQALNITTVPKTITILGGGSIGLEFATYFQSIGSKVSIIEKSKCIANNIDNDIIAVFQKKLLKIGVDVILDANVREITNKEIYYESHGLEKKIEYEHLLLCTGRVPFTKNIGLRSIGVDYNEFSIPVDSQCMTNVKNVYAIGDVNGHCMLAHTAYREATVVINNIIKNIQIMQYETIPKVIYTNPEIAFVGETEESAIAKGIKYRKVKVPMQLSGKYIIENGSEESLIKILIESDTKKVIGIHMIGNGSSEIIYGAGMIVGQKMNIDDANNIVFPHPTISEAIGESLLRLD